MSEIVDDLKIANIEISGDLGLNLSSENARIKHTGEGLLELFSYGRIEITTESGDEDEGDENQGNLNIDVNNRMFIHVDGEDTEETSALTIETEEGSIEIAAKKKIEITAESEDDEAIEIEAENGGINIEAETKINIEASNSSTDAITIQTPNGGIQIEAGSTSEGNIEIEAQRSVSITSYLNAVDSINIQAENGGVQIQSSTNSYTQFIGGFVGNTDGTCCPISTFS